MKTTSGTCKRSGNFLFFFQKMLCTMLMMVHIILFIPRYYYVYVNVYECMTMVDGTKNYLCHINYIWRKQTCKRGGRLCTYICRVVQAIFF